MLGFVTFKSCPELTTRELLELLVVQLDFQNVGMQLDLDPICQLHTMLPLYRRSECRETHNVHYTTTNLIFGRGSIASGRHGFQVGVDTEYIQVCANSDPLISKALNQV
jgi:hypothetical protein